MNRLLLIVLFLAAAISVAAQRKPAPKPVSKPAPGIFAVLNDGKYVEPIAKIERGVLKTLSDGADEGAKLKKFGADYYKRATKYKLVFGGADAGAVTIGKFDPSSECARNIADVTVTSTRAKLKGMVMGLATNAPVKGSGVRRLPTAAERAEAETLVREELIGNSVTASAVKNLKYHNLTALDLDSDGKAELVGSFWVETGAKERATLFFIAEKGADGKLKIGISEFKTIKEEEVMSGEIKAVDEGVYHELLLDVLDFNADGFSEVFTYVQGFEGSSFNAYGKKDGKWERLFEGSNYHCGY